MKISWQETFSPVTVGIDIDINAVKLVTLKKIGSIKPIFKLLNYAYITTTREFPSMQDAVRNALQQAGISKKSKIIIALPYGQVLIQTIKINTSDIHKVEEEIVSHCEQIIAYPLQEACIDFELIQDAQDMSNYNAKIVIARRSSVEEKIVLFGTSGFSVTAVDVESDALARCILYVLTQMPDYNIKRFSTAIHIRAQTILGIIFYEQKILFIQEIVINITDTNGIKQQQYLEKIKILYSMFELAINNFLKIYCDFRENFNCIFVSGNLFLNKKFVSHIEQIMHKKAHLVNPFLTMRIKDNISAEDLTKHTQDLIISCGLALRD